MKKAIFALISTILLILTILSIKAYRRFNADTATTEAATSEITTESTKAPETAKPSETTTQKETKTATSSQAKPTERESTTEALWLPSPELDEPQHLGKFYITGYTAEEGFAEGSATASGIGCRPGICAMNNQQRKELGIKYGDSIFIEGLGIYQVQDCGCAYGVIDIWCYKNAEAYALTGFYEVYTQKGV